MKHLADLLYGMFLVLFVLQLIAPPWFPEALMVSDGRFFKWALILMAQAIRQANLLNRLEELSLSLQRKR